ncbi:hypothetical protein EVAR_49887_1 [Eumeta japonica]|uniref:Uncharacterized protein n=1 Tax=Eumeta variegata TaxID=151549 RepID=A0A4C1XWJ1_EUMVA|nr:hypothetical protein EVAR_49887_1 [Eumeta japonica]
MTDVPDATLGALARTFVISPLQTRTRPNAGLLAVCFKLSLEEVDTPALNNIPDVIETTDEIDSSIGALTNHIKKVVKRCSREVPASVDRRKLPADALELLRAKNAALRLAYAYPTRE